MKIHTLLTTTGVLLCSAGLALIVPLGVSWREQRQAVAAAPASSHIASVMPAEDNHPEVIKGVPRRVVVPSAGIDIAVADGVYDAKTGQWTLSQNSAFYATPTSPVNSAGGNTLIYGHATAQVFGKLAYIQPGAEAMVTTDTGYVFTFVFTSKETVKPTDVMALEYHGAPRLTLQTCSGFWSQTRDMVYFQLKNYRKV